MMKIKPLQDITLTLTVPQGATIDTICKDIVKKLKGEYEIEKESEDERIRKGLLAVFKRSDLEVWSDEELPIKSIISWLEKQKGLFEEYDWNDYKDKPVEIWNAYIHGKAVGLERGKNAVKNSPKDYGLEKQGEQKPLSTEETELNSIAFLEQLGYTCIPPKKLVLVNPLTGEKVYERESPEYMNQAAPEDVDAILHLVNKGWGVVAPGKEQKPAEWSEEDEKMIKSILFVLESYVSHSESASSPSLITTYPTYYKEIDWLKSLKDKGNSLKSNTNPPSEWSEEDTKYIANIKEALHHSGFRCKDWIGTLEFVNSLRPHWKPSEWQMSLLLAVINEPNNAGSESCHLALKSLYKDLKKL